MNMKLECNKIKQSIIYILEYNNLIRLNMKNNIKIVN